MPASFTLRPMQPSDGSALQVLMETDPPAGGMSSTTHFRVDPYQAWHTLKPDSAGVVAEMPDGKGLAGCATVAFSTVQYNGRTLTAGLLENLKVHHTQRRQGMGAQLAAWRVDAARARFQHENAEGDGVIVTATSTDNTASQATMRTWASEFYMPLTISIRPTVRHAPHSSPAGMTFRPAQPAELEAFADGANRFYADFNLYSPLSAEGIAHQLAAAPDVFSIYASFDRNGRMVGGALLCHRTPLMVDQFTNVPLPLRVINRAVHLLPDDGQMRLTEVNAIWAEDAAIGHALWEQVRYAYREKASTFSVSYDPRSPVAAIVRPRRWHVPKVNLVLALHARDPMDRTRFVSDMARG